MLPNLSWLWPSNALCDRRGAACPHRGGQTTPYSNLHGPGSWDILAGPHDTNGQFHTQILGVRGSAETTQDPESADVGQASQLNEQAILRASFSGEFFFIIVVDIPYYMSFRLLNVYTPYEVITI